MPPPGTPSSASAHGIPMDKPGKALCQRAFALHRQQPEKDKQYLTLPSPGKISADAHACTDFDLILGS